MNDPLREGRRWPTLPPCTPWPLGMSAELLVIGRVHARSKCGELFNSVRPSQARSSHSSLTAAHSPASIPANLSFLHFSYFCFPQLSQQKKT